MRPPVPTSARPYISTPPKDFRLHYTMQTCKPPERPQAKPSLPPTQCHGFCTNFSHEFSQHISAPLLGSTHQLLDESQISYYSPQTPPRSAATRKPCLLSCYNYQHLQPKYPVSYCLFCISVRSLLLVARYCRLFLTSLPAVAFIVKWFVNPALCGYEGEVYIDHGLVFICGPMQSIYLRFYAKNAK